ncbi:MAG TPA: COX15/CtaA family protein [Mucilaginibacter sp.]|jgi:cytochrome c oxidase assembly protein subunit 15|nr:COX15/CtaA family protein [Mucilaginibacter sp.]
MNNTTAQNRFQKINLISIIVLFVLILAGGVVRSTGSGMGCPDWPKCFGCVVPPTTVSQLPKDYKKKYVAERQAKNLRFARELDKMGFHDLAMRLRLDRSVLVPEEFNAAKTWTEYINRLIGMITGFLLLACAMWSFYYWSKSKTIVFLSILNLILVGFQAWLGSIVVSSNLVSWIVTVHMLLALAILAIGILTYHLAKVYGKTKIQTKSIIYVVTFICIAISIVQIGMGTGVRESIDAVSVRLSGYRDGWVNSAGQIFLEHRDLAILVLLSNVMLYALIRKYFNRHSVQQQLMSFNFLIIMLQIVTGIILSYLALPPVAQMLHVLLASLMFGAQFYLLLNLYRSANTAEVRR